MPMSKTNALRTLVLFLMLAAGIAVTPLAVRAAPMAGSLIKRPDNPALYYYASNGKRYVFPNERVFRTWYVDFSSVQTVTAAELAAMPIGGNVTYRPGFRMIKIDTDSKVYAISRGGLLRPIASEAVAAAVFGPAWATMIDDIPDAFFVNYTIGAPIASAADFNRGTELSSAPTINSDKSFGELPATTPLPTPPTATPSSCTADTWYCQDWNICSPSGMQSRSCTMIVDCPTATTPSPAVTQSCTSSPACTADSWYCTQWNACSASGAQTRFCTMTIDCPTVVTPSPETSQSCTPPSTETTCTEDSWYCTQWNSCSASGNQTRFCNITNDCPSVSTPSPATTQTCTPPATEPSCTADTWYCQDWNVCSPSGAQSRSCTMIVDCPTATTPMPTTYQSCTPPTGGMSCTEDSWYCTQWNACSPSGNQTRFCNITNDCPSVTTPSPATTQTCTP